jgi:hypothetical protein
VANGNRKTPMAKLWFCLGGVAFSNTELYYDISCGVENNAVMTAVIAETKKPMRHIPHRSCHRGHRIASTLAYI